MQETHRREIITPDDNSQSTEPTAMSRELSVKLENSVVVNSHHLESNVMQSGTVSNALLTSFEFPL